MNTHKSTNPSNYYARQNADEQPMMGWSKPPTWIERNGEFIAAVIGFTTIALAAGGLAGAFVASVLS